MSSASNENFAKEIDHIVKKFAGWRGEKLSQIRRLIKLADPEVLEEVKWKAPSNPDGVPVWSHDGIICTGETYQKHLRIAFPKGPLLKDNDPNGLINTYRAIIIREDDEVNETAFIEIIRNAIKLNQQSKKK